MILGCWFLLNDINAQIEAIPLQAIIEEDNGPISNQEIDVRLSFLSDGLLDYEEIHTLSTNELGLFNLLIGKGVNTGNGTINSFNDLDWAKLKITLKVEADIDKNGNYFEVGTSFLYGVPYAFYAENKGNASFSNLDDLKGQTPQYGQTIMWKGGKWTLGKPESVNWSNHSGRVTYADTALFVKGAAGSLGNVEEIVVGTNQSDDLVFKTNNTERLRFKANGNTEFHGLRQNSSFSINDAFLLTAPIDSSITYTERLGNYFFYDGAHHNLRIGLYDDPTIVDSLLAFDSFGGGKNSFSGKGSISWGDNCRGVGFYHTVFGKDNIADWRDKTAPKANSSVVLGVGNHADRLRQMNFGYNSTTSRFSTAVSMGYGNYCRCQVSYALGYGIYVNTRLSGNTMAIGYYARANRQFGNFIFMDASTKNQHKEIVTPNQLVVRAIGGTYFFSDSNSQSGVNLLPGAGAWTSVSDKSKKINFNLVESETVLSKIQSIPVYRWNYKSQDSSNEHMGPTAQDFYRAFELGKTEKRITTGDFDGIVMAGIKGVAKRLERLEMEHKKIDKARGSVVNLKKEFENISDKISLLESKVEHLKIK